MHLVKSGVGSVFHFQQSTVIEACVSMAKAQHEVWGGAVEGVGVHLTMQSQEPLDYFYVNCDV